ncbi:5'/3'-nucleotidase SurE [Candidatus Haliotispira prima]|uniref:5'-nucleotidase SurE n=1 Tax=Candidatus Haliotispira prima TaxID=3034016 RepID=A0ABY8MG50_9SPIO|nr:5'/3'-nucleotidase SurE [Candidatus Haliotispira prima]
MKILITNDDGYGHPGHRSLRKILEKLGHEVWSIAPRENQSGVGMKLTLGKSLEFQVLDRRSWSCSGTPVDCVLFALHGILPFRPDAVISGINAGANLSDDLWYSGTAGAAREACKWGLPSLALSYSASPPYREPDFIAFAALLEQHLDNLFQACELTESSGAESGSFMGFLNVNIPADCNSGEICLAGRFEQRHYQNTLQKVGEDQYMLCGKIDPKRSPSPGVDTLIDARSQISISLGSFHALQPLPYQSALYSASNQADGSLPEPLCLRPSERAERAMTQIVRAGIFGTK